MKAPRLNVWRQVRGFSQTELAKLSGVNRATIARIESGGESHPSTLRKLSAALDVQVVDLMSTEDAATLRDLVDRG